MTGDVFPRRCGAGCLIALACLSGICAPQPVDADEEERPIEIVTAAVRSRGHVCEHPEKAVRDTKKSEPGKTVWVLSCEATVYRVTFFGDAGPLVEPVE